MDKRVAFFSGLGLGAGAMFLLDPDRGKRRRALMRDKAIHISHTSKEALEKTARDLRNRATGIVAETKAMLNEEQVPDSVLVERVRATLGHYPVHDRAIHIEARDGVVTLTGDTLANEVETLIDAVSSVRGVKDVVNHLVVHEDANGISALQGSPASARSATAH
jgi:osmotically-inducible protein OsmY